MPRLRPSLLRGLGVALCLLSACQPATPERPRAEVGADDLLATIYRPDRGVDQRTLDEILAGRRIEFVPVLVELLRFERSGSGIPAALELLTGEPRGADWALWVEWLGGRELPTPRGFDAWKADLFATIDVSFREFLYGGVPTRIRLEEIVWGGVRKDGIPALVDPKFVAASDARYLTEAELVFGISINGDTRAYPHRILDWHEMANDVVGGVPIALTY
jgi:hypothetical protein